MTKKKLILCDRGDALEWNDDGKNPPFQINIRNKLIINPIYAWPDDKDIITCRAKVLVNIPVLMDFTVFASNHGRFPGIVKGQKYWHNTPFIDPATEKASGSYTWNIEKLISGRIIQCINGDPVDEVNPDTALSDALAEQTVASEETQMVQPEHREEKHEHTA